MRGSLLAKRYAKALLELGLEERALERMQEEMERLAEALQREPILLKFLSYKEVALEKKRKLLDAMTQALLLSSWIKNFLRLLMQKGRIQHLPAIAEMFAELVRENEGWVIAKVETAQQKSGEAVAEKLTAALGRLAGKKVRCEFEENPKLLGGLRVRLRDQIYDASVAGALERMTEEARRKYGN